MQNYKPLLEVASTSLATVSSRDLDLDHRTWAR